MGYWFWGIELHRKLLFDSLRNKSFRQAFKQVIKPGQSVTVDIGAGSGYLSFLCSRLGAKQCFLIEADDHIVEVGKQIAIQNNIDKCHWIEKHSSKVKPTDKQKGDIVFSETLGCFAYEENLIENLNEAKRFLKPNGIVIPGKISQYVAPVISSRPFTQLVQKWDSIDDEMQFDFFPLKSLETRNLIQYKINPEELLNQPICWDSIDFNSETKISSIREPKPLHWKIPSNSTSSSSSSTQLSTFEDSSNTTPQRTATTKSKPKRQTLLEKLHNVYSNETQVSKKSFSKKSKSELDLLTIYGFCLWWNAELVPGVELSTSPFSQRTHWDQAFLPLLQPLVCEPNDKITLDLKCHSDFDFGAQVIWDITHSRGTKQLLTLSNGSY